MDATVDSDGMFHALGARVLGAKPRASAPAAARAHRPLDCLWRDTTTGARVFVGDVTAARCRRTLDGLGITHVVNCQGLDSTNFFEADGRFSYLRFPIAHRVARREPAPDDGKGLVRLFAPLFQFVDSALARGASVLVHCLAGAHRAGASGVALLMHLDPRLSAARATRLARARRPAIEPILFLRTLLDALEREIRAPREQRRALQRARAALLLSLIHI